MRESRGCFSIRYECDSYHNNTCAFVTDRCRIYEATQGAAAERLPSLKLRRERLPSLNGTELSNQWQQQKLILIFIFLLKQPFIVLGQITSCSCRSKSMDI